MKPAHILALFFVIELSVVLFAANGASCDEGIYVLAGTSLLLGRNDDFAYHLWLDGSPYLFPLASGVAYLLGGLVGSRLVAVAAYLAGLAFFARFVRRCFGRAAALAATALLCANGAFFSVAHLAVYDAFAFLGLCGCLCSAREIARAPRLKWIVRGACLGALAAVSKYTVLILLLPCLVFSVLASRFRPWRAALACALASALLAVGYMLALHEQIIPARAFEILRNHQEYADRSHVAFAVGYLLALPACLALIGVRHLRRSDAALGWGLFAAGLIWPLLHIVAGEGVSLHKHVALSLVYLYPLVGVTFVQLWQRQRAAAFSLGVACAVWGVFQYQALDRSWTDVRPVVDYLLPKLRRDETVGLESGWDLAMYAVVGGPLKGPASIMDGWHLRRGKNACDNDWIISTRPAGNALTTPGRGLGTPAAAPGTLDAFAGQAERCSFDQVATFPATYTRITPLWPEQVAQQFVLFRRPRHAQAEFDRAGRPALARQ